MSMVKIDSLDEFYGYLDAHCMFPCCSITLECQGFEGDDILDRSYVWEFDGEENFVATWIACRMAKLKSFCTLTGFDQDGTVVAVCEVAANGRPTVMDTEP